LLIVSEPLLLKLPQEHLELWQVAERSEVGIRLQVGEVLVAGLDRLAQRGQRVGDVLLPLDGLLGSELAFPSLDAGGT
jgi:hypothetical protein